MNSRRTRLRSALAVILTVLVLVPTGILFGRVWSDASDRHDSTKLEQQGVDYLTALAPLTNALTEQESSAIIGVQAPPDDLKNAISRVTAADDQYGDALSTKQRWSDLQAKITKATSKKQTGAGAYESYKEITDLQLALYNAVRRNSGLNRDPDNDLSNLQQAVAVVTPQIVVHADRIGDLASMLQNLGGAAKLQYGNELNEEILNVGNLVDELTDDLQAAVDNTSSKTLSGSLVTTVDGFRRGVESMVRGAQGTNGNPNIATVTTAQSSLQSGIEKLSGTLLTEMGSLLDDRLDTDSYRQTEALVLGIVTILLVVGAIAWPAVSRRRQPEAPVSAPAAPIGESTRDNRDSRSSGGYGQYDQVPNYGEVNPTRRERSGAVR